jgi:hypothetical protein
MTTAAMLIVLLASAVAQDAPADPNAPSSGRPLTFRVFQNMDRPVAGRWVLEVPAGASHRIEISEAADQQGLLVGIDLDTREEVLRVQRKREGIGYSGELKKIFGPCGLDTLPVREFLPLGDTIQIRFETAPPEAACPPIDSGQAGKLEAFTAGGGMVRLRDLSDISSPTTREAYSIGGDRGGTETTLSYRLDAVTVEPGSEMRFRQRLKAPLDGSLWFEVEAVVSPEAGVDPPRGFVRATSLRFVGTLTMRREPAPPDGPRNP